MWNQILSDSEQELLGRERELLQELQELSVALGISEADRKALQNSILQLDQLFLLVVVGEFNSGKSAFINALLGQKILAEGVTPTTTRIQVVQRGQESRREVETPTLERVWVNADSLRQLQIVDTPGTNAILREHEAITREFVPRADLVLFVTSADRPFTESERGFLEKIRQWGKKVVVVVNKVDILEEEADVEKVRLFVREHLRKLLGAEPEVFTVSARWAAKRKQQELPEVRAKSDSDQFAELETYILETLDQGERLRLKLSNPLGIGSNLAREHLAQARERLESLEQDLKTLREIDSQLDLYQQDTAREFRLRLTEIDRVLHAFENRGVAFFDERMRLGRILDLLNKSRMKADYQSTVIGDAPKEIEGCVEDLVDWMLAGEIRQWEQIRDQLQQRDREARLAGRAAAFEQDRRRLIGSVGQHAQKVLESYDREKESSRISEDLQMTVAGTALVEVGAIGLGALVNLLATTTLADVTGLVAAGAVAVVGLFVIPARRRQAKRQLRERIHQMRRQLMDGLNRHFDREQKTSLSRIHEAMAPYSRFVRGQESSLRENRQRLEEWLEQVQLLELQIDQLR